MINQFNKTHIIRSFNRAAISYNKASFLQCKVGEQLFYLLPKHSTPSLVVDLGCGTGVFTAKLAHTFPHAEVIGIDIADNMIKHAQKYFTKENNLKFWCADADNLPLKSATTNIIFSNLMLQWSTNIEITLTEWFRVLKPGGQLLLSTVGSGSLKELSSSWARIDSYSHGSNFITKKQLLLAINKMGFKNLQFVSQRFSRTFASIYDLMLELKMLGAHNISHNRQRGLLGKNKLKQLQIFYDEYRDHNNKLPCSFEIYYVSACK